MEGTEPRVRRLFYGLYRETGIGPQGLAGAGLSAFAPALLASAKPMEIIYYVVGLLYKAVVFVIALPVLYISGMVLIVLEALMFIGGAFLVLWVLFKAQELIRLVFKRSKVVHRVNDLKH